MQPVFNNKRIEYLVGDENLLAAMQEYRVRPVMDERVIAFFHALSRGIQKNVQAKGYVDLLSYAFWVRRSHIEKEKVRFENKNKMGRGVSFHVAPSNVPVNFAVSMTSSALAGNACVIRVSNKPFEQVAIITAIMRELLREEFKDLKDMFCIIRYDHDKAITDALSMLCDIRIVWGGDATIQLIRTSPLRPRSMEMTFSDRHSIALINSDHYMEQEAGEIAELFYTDTYYSDQNACSSPKLVVWSGSHIPEAKERFWAALRRKVAEDYTFSGVMAIDKLDVFTQLAMQHPEVRYQAEDNICVRIEVPELYPDLMQYKMYGGYFFEYHMQQLSELEPILKKECQTISCLGVDENEVIAYVRQSGSLGVDRVVPMGHTMDLSFFWDGYDMIDTMSRYVDQYGLY